jgi:hypothetical protein
MYGLMMKFLWKVTCYADLILAVNDLRAIPYVDMSVSTQSMYWPCRSCNIMGIHNDVLGTQFFIGAVRWLSKLPPSRRRSALKARWKRVCHDHDNM